MKLSEEHLQKIEELKKRYQTTKALTLPVLWMAQKEFGWISSETMAYVAELLNVPVNHVYGVVTFYTMYNPNPVGKYHLQVCTNISCQLLGGDELRDHICRKLNVKPGEMTKDEKFTVTEVECLGSCGTAPAIQVNDDYHESLSIEKVDALLAGLK